MDNSFRNMENMNKKNNNKLLMLEAQWFLLTFSVECHISLDIEVLFITLFRDVVNYMSVVSLSLVLSWRLFLATVPKKCCSLATYMLVSPTITFMS